ncbi:hypothetical protein K469DRAFT_740459, partial [Zopfia rhizophila CBS 207.26]
MFSPALGRVVRSTSSISPPSVCTLGRPAAALGASQQSFSRRLHQRRLSSSNASIPPDGSNGSSSAQQTPGTSTTKAPAKKSTGRAGRKRTITAAINVPHVPPTDYLQKNEVKVSSFFSLHRPISLTKAVPEQTTTADFESIFQPGAKNSKRAMMDNMQTLSSGIESLEAALRGHDQKQSREEVLQSEADVKHLDGAPPASLDRFMLQFVPFRPPPAPSPVDPTLESKTTLNQQTEDASPRFTPVKQRAWSTAVVVTESTDASGKRTYSATTAPMVEIQVPAVENSQELDEIEIRQPFLERMRQRQNTYYRYRDNKGRPDMLLISVKRQRKLKMKKHKYKKLMKKTRLLRRKLDRA